MMAQTQEISVTWDGISAIKQELYKPREIEIMLMLRT